MAKSRGKRGGIVKTNGSALIFGIIFAVMTFFVTAFLGAAVANGLENPTGNIGLISICTLFITAAASGFAVSKYKGEGGVLPSVLSALFFALVLLIVGLVMTGGHLPVIVIVNLGAYVLVATIFALLGKKRANSHRRRR